MKVITEQANGLIKSSKLKYTRNERKLLSDAVIKSRSLIIAAHNFTERNFTKIEFCLRYFLRILPTF